MKWWHIRPFTIAAAVLVGMALRDLLSWWLMAPLLRPWAAVGVFAVAAASCAAAIGLFRAAWWAHWLALGLAVARVGGAVYLIVRFDPPAYVAGIAVMNLVAVRCLLDRRPRAIDVTMLCAGMALPAIAAHIGGFGPSPLGFAMFRGALLLVATGVVGLSIERTWGLLAIAAAALAMAVAASVELAAALGVSTADCLGAGYHLSLPDLHAAAAAAVVLAVGVTALMRPLLRASR